MYAYILSVDSNLVPSNYELKLERSCFFVN